MFSRKLFLFLTGLLLLTITPVAAIAQDGDVVLSIAVPELSIDVYKAAVAEFEAANPGIRVVVNKFAGFDAPIYPQADIEAYLDAVADYVSSADVLAVTANNINYEATLAGYLLDLSPLTSSDSTLNPEDFYEAMWQSFQWDNGVWALPVSGDYVILFYDPVAFDAAGLEYPNDNWSIFDIDTAIRALTKLDEDGKVASMGFLPLTGDMAPLALSLLGHKVYDDSVFPPVPTFVDPKLEEMLTVWMDITADGLLELPADGELDLQSIPFILSPSFYAAALPLAGGADLRPALLPGGRAGLDVEGFAVSSGTQYPEEAYELAKFMTFNIDAASSSYRSAIPARRSLVGLEPSNTGDYASSFNAVREMAGTSDEMATIQQLALENAIPSSEIRYSGFLDSAASKMAAGDLDATAALEEVQSEFLDRAAVAEARRDTVEVIVDTPNLTPEMASGEVALKFAATAFISPFPNEKLWQDAAAEFAANDPEVGAVQLDTSFPPTTNTLGTLAESYDCFFVPGNFVPDADLSLLRSIDPLLASDPSFDPNDMVGGVMEQVRRDDQTWAMPITIEPVVLRYNIDMFNHAGALLPTTDWTISDFENALRALKLDLGDTEPFVPQSFDNSYLQALVVAYGGLLFDYTTTPPTPTFTDPATVEATRQVLNLVKDGYIKYTSTIASGGVVVSLNTGDSQRALYMETLNSLGLGGALVVNAGDQSQNTDGLTLFPHGSQYSVVSYDIDSAYISANAQNAEACYRFIDYLAKNTALFPSMPARRSLINSPEVAESHGAETAAFYNDLDTLIQQPNTIEIPSLSLSNVTSVLDAYWLNRAFDRYIEEDADLEAELADAQLLTAGYQECVAGIPPYDPEVDNQIDYYQQYSDCAIKVDPDSVDYFGTP